MHMDNDVGKMLVFFLFILCMAIGVFDAQPSSWLVINASQSSVKKISPTMFGISFEEISHSGVGGLWAELVNNRGFEAGGQNVPSNISPWAIVGNVTMIFVTTDRSSCFDRNKIALRLEVTCDTSGEHSCPVGGVGVYNPGFWGMNIEQGQQYKVAFYVRTLRPIHISVSLIGSNELSTLASADIVDDNFGNWTKKEIILQANGSNPKARLQLTTRNKGVIWLDQVSAMPLNTHKGQGFRKDLFDMLADLNPGFLRFPGGSFVEGRLLMNSFRWKDTIGPWENRPGHFGDVWQYWTDDGIGFFEYLQLAEELGASPVWVINGGISMEEQVNSKVMFPFVLDVLHGIEFARGDPTSTWGSIRASMGHKEPFDLQYVAVGNQDCFGDYREKYMKFWIAVKDMYPDIKMISNCDGSTGKLDHPADLYDSHVYTNPNSLFSSAHNFDNSPRNGPKAFVSEYAATGGDVGAGNLLKALAEAVFLLGLERNSDVVEMASNAPLFVNINSANFRANAIVFDSSKAYGTPTYWMQHFFKSSNGATLLCSELGTSSSSSLVASAISYTNKTENRSYLGVKVMNYGGNNAVLNITIQGLNENTLDAAGSTVTTLTSTNPKDENSFNEPTKVAPKTSPLPNIGNNIHVVLPPYSLNLLNLLMKPSILQVVESGTDDLTLS